MDGVSTELITILDQLTHPPNTPICLYWPEYGLKNTGSYFHTLHIKGISFDCGFELPLIDTNINFAKLMQVEGNIQYYISTHNKHHREFHDPESNYWNIHLHFRDQSMIHITDSHCACDPCHGGSNGN